VAKNVDAATAIFVTEHRDLFPEVTVDTTSERRYPNDTTAADVVGYIGQINADELKAHSGGSYDARDIIGKTGIESMFESQLRGTPGKDKVEVDNQGRRVNVVDVEKPVPGDDVHLTVDLPMQKVAEDSLQQGIDGARSLVDPDSGSYYKANAGAVVVLDARTGSLVAMASNPPFNPNDFIAGNGDQYFAAGNNSPLINRALTPYAPGSTFKAFTSIAMLQSPTLFPDGAAHTVSESPAGCFTFGNETDVRCNAGKAVLGTADLPRALTVSSDVYFYSVGNQFWNAYRDEGLNAGHGGLLAGDAIPDPQHPVGNAIQHTARTYGFGESTNLGLGDQQGSIPDHEFRVERNPNNNDLQVWRRGDSASLAVGQGDVLVTPLQLANAYAAFANGGTLFEPRLAASVTASTSGLAPGQAPAVVSALQSKVRRTTGLTPEVRGPIESGLAGVVEPNGNGTAAGAFNNYTGMPVIGKTGTAQVSGKQDTSWFAAITNPDNADPAVPQYVVVVMVDEGGFGASTAAPIARRVIDFLNNPNEQPPPVIVAPAVGNEQSN
jgi:penicillin-binding protein 2